MIRGSRSLEGRITYEDYEYLRSIALFMTTLSTDLNNSI